MKKASKLGYLLWLPVLVWAFMLCIINVVNGDVSIRIPAPGYLHRSLLFSLSLWRTEADANVTVDVDNRLLNVSNWIVMWENNDVANSVNYASIWWWKGNYIAASVEKSGIWWWNGNAIGSSFSVIWWWSGNSINWGNSQANAIAWWASNITQAGGTVVGWLWNNAKGTWVILWWQNNSFDGDGSMILWSDSQWGKWSFSWNSSISQNYSAIIMATGGALIWTYETVSWVNLVVDWAVKLWNNSIEWMAGEIRLQSWCFYGYDGSQWHVINRWLWNQCFDNEITCKFGSTVLYPGDSVWAYTSPYSDDCVLQRVTCYDDWTLWDGDDYYPYCHDFWRAICGGAAGNEYENIPLDDLCLYWSLSDFTSGGMWYTWKCKHKNMEVECSATKRYSCGSDVPDYWAEIWATYYYYWYNVTEWTYESEGDLWACEWRCKPWYVRVEWTGNECEKIGVAGKCVSNDVMFSNQYEHHIKRIGDTPTEAVNVQKSLYRTEEAEGHYCSYVCAGGYEFLPASWDKSNRCTKCIKWTENRDINGVLVSCSEYIDICDEGYGYEPTINKCIAFWSCLWGNLIKDEVPVNSNITEVDSVRPMLWEPLMNWTCNGNDSSSVESNQCQYACEWTWNLVCKVNWEAWSIGCVEVVCNDSTAANRDTVSPGRKWEKPGTNNGNYDSSLFYFAGGKYKQYRQYQEATNMEDFQNKVANKKWCYFWCPEDHLCKLDPWGGIGNDPYSMDTYWKCYASKAERDAKCKTADVTWWWQWASTPICVGYYDRKLLWYVMYSPFVLTGTENINFRTFYVPWEYVDHKSEWCYEGCSISDTLVEYGNKKICWRKCPDGQYFDTSTYNNSCRNCPIEGYMPNPNNILTDERGISNSISCTYRCDAATERWNKQLQKCIPLYANIAECEDGWTLVEIRDWEYECVWAPETVWGVCEDGFIMFSMGDWLSQCFRVPDDNGFCVEWSHKIELAGWYAICMDD